MKRRSEWFVLVTLLGAVAFFLGRLIRASRVPGGPVAYDIYSYCYPTMLIAVRTVLSGGNGFFWNPFNCCGEPFFGSGTTGVLYPPAILSLVLPGDPALYGLLLFNLVVATVSAYLLCRELGAGVVASWCGALAFGLSNASSDVMTYARTVSGPYAWLPAAMLFCERILRGPTVRRAVALAITVALALIPGHPQLVLYLYQLIAVRVLWQFLTRPGTIRMRTLGMMMLGLTLGPLLVAVQLVPYLEVMREGVRSAGLPLKEVSSLPSLTWAGLRKHVGGWDIDNPFLLMPWVLAAVAFANSGKRRLAVFYAAVAAASVDLSLGPNGHLFSLYYRLPFGTLFHEPSRFLWVTSLCIAVLVALGVDAIVTPGRAGDGWGRRGSAVALLVAGAVGYHFLLPIGLRSTAWLLVGVAVVGGVAAASAPRLGAFAAVAVVSAIATDLLVTRPLGFRRLLPDGDVLLSRAPLFTTLRERLTAQDRVYLAPRHSDFTLQPKTAPLFGVPVLFDYEPQPTRRWAAYFVKLRTGGVMTGVKDWGLVFPGGWFQAGLKRRLLDLAAARYLVVAAEEDGTASLADPPVRLLWSVGDVRVYENPTALPRAFYVPRVEVVADAPKLLERLATGRDDLRQVALVEEPPPSGYLGEPPEPGQAHVEFVTNDPEHLVLRVHAPQRGFLFLADQYFPGWHATVDGVPAPIARANYAFRVVAVPSGDSVVEFRYAPASVRAGAVVSGVALLGVVALLVTSRPAARPRACRAASV